MAAYQRASMQPLGDDVPSPRRRVVKSARRVASSIGLGLERNFESKVSMTPPARLPGSQNHYSPFDLPTRIDFPATEAKRNQLPRSQAFGPFSPLNVGHASNADATAISTGSNSNLRRTVALQGHMHALKEKEGNGKRIARVSSDEKLEAEYRSNPLVNASAEKSLADSFAISSVYPRFHPIAYDGNDAAGTSSPRRRRTATMPVRYRSSDSSSLHRMQTVESSSPPHGDTHDHFKAAIVQDDSSDEAADASSGSASEEDDDDVNTLRPGATFSCRRMSGVRSISASHSRQHTAPGAAVVPTGGEMMARSATTSQICECGCGSTQHAHQREQMAARKESSRGLANQTTSPFRTPNKRRARIQGSSSSSLRGRNFSTASPVAAPADSEEGTLFGSTSSSSIGFDLGDEADSVHRSFYESKRRSVGSLSHWQESTPLPSHGSSKRGLAAMAGGPRRPSLTAFTRISSEADQHYDSPARLTFDDSGVALQSPADASVHSDKQRAERVLTKSITRPAMKVMADEPSSSPSKLAAARRGAASENQGGELTLGGKAAAATTRGRSSLANETHFSDEDSSANSTPEIRRRFASAASVPENLVSPSNMSKHSRSSQSSSSLAVEGVTAPYLTPQNYKNVVPLQAAFMSTGLASKRSRPILANLDPLSGEPLPPLPAKLSFGNNVNAAPTYQSSGNMAASLGLRDVVAAANAHAAAAANTSTTSTMPDTPVKRPVASFAGAGSKSGIPIRSRLNMALSPISNDGNESSSGGSMCGGDSPLLNQDCDSPTLGLTSIVSTRCRSPMSMLEASSQHEREASSGSSTAEHVQPNNNASLAPNRLMTSSVSPTKSIASKRSIVRQSLPSQLRTTTEDSLRTQVMSRPLSLSRPPLGLQRKSSFGPGSEQSAMLSVQSPLFDVPSTPTRHSSTIKWYEAAQLMSTPSPSHRRQSNDGRRESWQASGSMRGKGGSRKNSMASGSLLMPPAPPIKTSRTTRISYFETRFVVQSVLGVGEFSQVDKVEDKTDAMLYAVKRMKRAYSGPRDRLRRLEEVDILRHLSKNGGHQNIVAFFDAWEEAGHLFIQTELCPCVDFSSFLQHFSNMGGSLDEARLWKVMCELKDGLGYIHDMQVLHLDLKPANIFITEIATLKIGDFGMATRWPPVDATTTLTGAGMGDEQASSQDGGGDTSTLRTPKSLEREGDREYMAPEIMRGQYTEAADVFSLGLVMLEAAGNVILPDNGEPWQKLRNNDLSDVDLSQFSMSLVNLIRACLASDPTQRPTVADLHAHPVLRAVGQRVAMGVEKSELDQLPIFDMTTGESTRSLNSVQKRNVANVDHDVALQSSGDTEMTMDGIQDDVIVPSTPKPSNSNDSSAIESALMERTSSGQSALGLEGVEDDDKVLDLRGALIYENLDFLITILEAEPVPEYRMTSMIFEHCKAPYHADDEQTLSHIALVNQHQDVPIINVDMDADDQFSAFGLGGNGAGLRIGHAPPRASPLRHTAAAHQDELDEMEMDT